MKEASGKWIEPKKQSQELQVKLGRGSWVLRSTFDFQFSAIFTEEELIPSGRRRRWRPLRLEQGGWLETRGRSNIAIIPGRTSNVTITRSGGITQKCFSHECTNLCHFSAFEAEVAKLPLILLFQTELRAELRGPKCLFLRELPCRKKDLQCNAFLALSNL